MKKDNGVIYFFKMILVDKKIEVECLNKHVFFVCRNYLATFASPDFVIKVSSEDLHEEIIRTIGIELYQKNIDERIATEYTEIESKYVLRKIAELFIMEGILLMHGATIAVDGKGFIFTAASGTGKTTHILNWLDMIPGTMVVNGDKPFINTNNMYVYGSPWCGKEGMNTNTAVPLAGIIVLERGLQNSIHRISFREALPVLIQQTYIPTNEHSIEGYTLLNRLNNVPCYKLVCNMDKESALVAYNGLLGFEKEI